MSYYLQCTNYSQRFASCNFNFTLEVRNRVGKFFNSFVLTFLYVPTSENSSSPNAKLSMRHKSERTLNDNSLYKCTFIIIFNLNLKE